VICLKNNRRAFGQADRELRSAEIARAADKRRVAWRLAEAAYETQMTNARPGPGGRAPKTDYPTAVRAAIAAWDKEMSN
jgi:hypothetical protein